ncbi:MAG: hypothetical protein KGP29_00115 [Proteobacteria bacterium]|nr:hypothetical protein [Pseudomonadota bacterium]
MAANKAHETYYPEKYCYVKARNKLRKELKIDGEDESLLQSVKGLFGFGRNPERDARRKEFNKVFREVLIRAFFNLNNLQMI